MRSESDIRSDINDAMRSFDYLDDNTSEIKAARRVGCYLHAAKWFKDAGADRNGEIDDLFKELAAVVGRDVVKKELAAEWDQVAALPSMLD